MRVNTPVQGFRRDKFSDNSIFRTDKFPDKTLSEVCHAEYLALIVSLNSNLDSSTKLYFLVMETAEYKSWRLGFVD